MTTNPLPIVHRAPSSAATPGAVLAGALTVIALVVTGVLTLAFGRLGFGIAAFSAFLPLLLLWRGADLPPSSK